MLQNWVEFRPCTVGQLTRFHIELQTIVVAFVSIRVGVFCVPFDNKVSSQEHADRHFFSFFVRNR